MAFINSSRRESSTGTLYRLALWSVALTGVGTFLFARARMTSTVSAAVMWHIAVGALVSLPITVQAFRRAVARNASASQRPWWMLAVCCSVSGLALIGIAACGASVGKAAPVYSIHVAAGFVVAVAAAASVVVSALRQTDAFRSPGARRSAGTAAMLLLLSGAAFGAYSYAADAYYRALTATTAAQAGNPLFPSNVQAASQDDWSHVAAPEACGQAGCHADALRQWSHSAHARSETSPYYRAALSYAFQRIGEDGARWCQGCHAPTVLLKATTDHERWTSHEVTHASVDCLGCHAIRCVPLPTGNGLAFYAPPPVYPFADARGALPRWMHGFFVRVRPEPHRSALSGPPEGPAGERICAPCHRLSVNLPQNHYRFVRYDDTWSDWQMSPFSGESLHTFSTAPRRDCASCHMGARFDHAMPPHGADSARRPSPVSVEIFALRRKAVARGDLDIVDAPLANKPVVVTPGETITIDVLVQNRGIGHGFPSGLPDQREAWVALTIEDVRGKTLLKSAEPSIESKMNNRKSRIGNRSPVHHYGLIALDRSGRPLDRANIFDMVAPLYLHGTDHARIIQAGEGDVARYTFTVPRGPWGQLRVGAYLFYQQFEPGFSEWVTGRPVDGELTPIAHDVVVLHVAQPGRKAPSSSSLRSDDSRDAPRFYAYGVALLLQSDFARARQAFNAAISLQPGRAEYRIGLARLYLATGDNLAARDALQAALKIEPGSRRAQAWLGATYRLMGQYDAALDLLMPLAGHFPRDRELWFDIGRCYFQIGRYEDAANAFSSMLAVDPDEVSGHFQLMQCYERLKRTSLARREEAIYQTLSDSEPFTEITEPYLRAHPEERIELLPMHEHRLVPQ